MNPYKLIPGIPATLATELPKDPFLKDLITVLDKAELPSATPNPVSFALDLIAELMNPNDPAAPIGLQFAVSSFKKHGLSSAFYLIDKGTTVYGKIICREYTSNLADASRGPIPPQIAKIYTWLLSEVLFRWWTEYSGLHRPQDDAMLTSKIVQVGELVDNICGRREYQIASGEIQIPDGDRVDYWVYEGVIARINYWAMKLYY